MRSDAATPEEYLEELPAERREMVEKLRNTILAALPDGYVESMTWGMLSYEVPLERYPETYNGKPLAYAALASQKNYVSLYLMGVYGDPETEDWFHEAYRESGKKLDMGKSCVRFKRLEDVPLEIVSEVIARWSVEDYLAHYEKVRS